jgi:ketosteroid isomerase-like protein
MTHPNRERLQAFLDAYRAKNRDLSGKALAQEAVWHVGGTHRLSGDYRGREAILDYFERTAAETAQSLRLEPVELMSDNRYGAAFLRVTAARAEKRLDVTMAEAFRFDEDGRITEFWAHATDQAAIDAFWS